MHFLIHVVSGEDMPTRSALGLLIAKSALDEGHYVEVFLAGDAAALAQEAVAARTNGLGTGNAGEWLAYLKEQNVPIYVSMLSARARGIETDALVEMGFIPSLPTDLVARVAAAERVLVY